MEPTSAPPTEPADALQVALSAYIAQDRRRAAGGAPPADDMGAILFADLSGFTPLTERLLQELGRSRGADALTRLLNRVYAALITEVEAWGGSVIGFSGDAITCWFSCAADHAGASHHGANGCREAAARALHAASALHGALVPFADVAVAEGVRASLSLKCTLASGRVRRMVVGNPEIQRIDVLAGEPVDRVAALEALARPGETFSDEQSVALLGTHATVVAWRGEGATRAALVQSSAIVAPPLSSAALPAAPDAESWVHAPVAAAIRSGHERFLAELRPSVALFVRFSGIDFAAGASDAEREQAASRLDAWVRWAQEVVAAHGGIVIQLTTGDKGSYLYAAFGAPVAHEDDSERALRAGLALANPPEEVAAYCTVQCGISEGLMRVGAYGGPTRRTYGVLGAEVNRAARLMMLAEPGQLLAAEPVLASLGIDSDEVARADAGAVPRALHVAGLAFTLHSRRLLKGFAGETALYIVAPSSGEQPDPTTEEPLIGRTDEMATLRSGWRHAQRNRGALLLVEGPAGVGKSHLVAQAVRAAHEDGLTVAVAACQSLTQQAPYAALRPLMRRLLGLPALTPAGAEPSVLVADAVTVMDPAWRERLPLLADLLGVAMDATPLTAALDAEQRQQATAALIVEVVRARTREQPWLFVIEDTHWLDEASAALLGTLVATLGDVALCLLTTSRPLDAPPAWADAAPPRLHRTHMLLGELDSDASRALLEQRLDGPLSSLAADLLLALSQGNPFYLEELADALRDSGRLVRTDDVWQLSAVLLEHLRAARSLTEGDAPRLRSDVALGEVDLGLPSTVHGLVLSRLDRLPEAARLTLKVASVFGRTFELPLLEAVEPLRAASELAAIRGAVLQALQRDFVRSEGAATAGERFQFKHNITHEVAYSTLLEEQQHELHLGVAHVLEERRPEAIEELAHHFAHSDTRLPAVRARALHYLEAAATRAARDYANETALAWLDQAQALETTPGLLTTRIGVLHVLARRDEEHAALAALSAAVEPQRAGPSTKVSHAHGSTAQDQAAQEQMRATAARLWGDYYEATGDFPSALDALELALDLARGVERAAILVRMGMVAWRQGDYAAAELRFTSALQRHQSAAHPTQVEADAHYGLGLVARQTGNLEGAETHFHENLALNQALGNRAGEARAWYALGTLASMRRDFAAALPWFERALDMRRTMGDRAGIGAGLLTIAQTRGSMGDHGAALPLLHEALQIQQSIRNRWEECLVWNELGILQMMLGEYGAAAHALEQGLARAQEIGSQIGVAYLTCNLGQVVREQGRLDDAERILREGHALAVEQEDSSLEAIYCGDLALTLLHASRPDEARTWATRALRLNVELEQESALTAIYATLAQAEQALGNCTAALAHARQAMALLSGPAGAEADFPQRDYWMCAGVFSACAMADEAVTAAAAARRALSEKAARMSDPALRAAYLQNTPLHRAILAATP